MCRAARVRLARAALVNAGLLVLLSGCAATTSPTLKVHSSAVGPDQPVRVSMAGLTPGALVDVRLTTATSSGKAWSSTATYRAAADGTVSTAQAPVQGDYTGARPDGLEEALHPLRGDTTSFFPRMPWRLRFTAAVGGRVVARGSAIRRTCLSDVTVRRLTLAHDHVLGFLYEPRRAPASPGPGVVGIGGSGGGYGAYGAACDLGAAGIPAISLAYFHEPGLPDQLERIPLEYFATAARIMAEAPGVDPHEVVLWGDSRGSEAAALTAAHDPTLVHGAVLTVPGAEAVSSTVSPDIPAWTSRGTAVPTAGIGAALIDPNLAALPVEKINGPVLAVCGGEDDVWPSCPNAARLRTRLQDHGRSSRFTLLTYPDAGHFVGSLLPYWPAITDGVVADGDLVVSGGTAVADAEARDDAWPRLLAWLHDL